MSVKPETGKTHGSKGMRIYPWPHFQLVAGQIPEAEMNVHDRPTAYWDATYTKAADPSNKKHRGGRSFNDTRDRGD